MDWLHVLICSHEKESLRVWCVSDGRHKFLIDELIFWTLKG